MGGGASKNDQQEEIAEPDGEENDNPFPLAEVYGTERPDFIQTQPHPELLPIDSLPQSVIQKPTIEGPRQDSDSNQNYVFHKIIDIYRPCKKHCFEL